MILETLKKSKIFSVLKEEELNQIISFFKVLEMKNDDYIFMEGDPSDWMYLVSQGRVKMVKHTLSGKDIILEIKHPGEIFCCATVLDNMPYPESALVMDDVSVMRISRDNLMKVIEKYPRLETEIAKYASERLRDAHDMVTDMASETVERRIASTLLKLAEKSGPEDSGYTKINFHLTRQDIADMVGTTVETCIRTFSKFQKQGVVKSSEGNIFVNAASLRSLLNPEI
jgi:CRP/FNR family transcriptional regulator